MAPYVIATHPQPVLRALIEARVDHQVTANDYPKRQVVQSRFEGVLGQGEQVKVTFAACTK